MPSDSSIRLWSFESQAHNATGFWGPVDANHAFCEPHYSVTPYVAEFFNSISSLLYVILALSLRFPKDRFVQCAQIWLVVIGLGSMLFHGTMRYVMQLVDEIPMVGFMTTLLLAKILKPHPWIGRSAAPLVATLAIVLSTALVSIYVLLDEYTIFVHGFTVLCLVDSILAVSMPLHRRYGDLQNRALLVGLISILLGRSAWESEHGLCATHPSVWPLHVAWHVCSCISAYGAMVFTYVATADNDAKMPRWWGFEQSTIKKRD